MGRTGQIIKNTVMIVAWIIIFILLSLTIGKMFSGPSYTPPDVPSNTPKKQHAAMTDKQPFIDSKIAKLTRKSQVREASTMFELTERTYKGEFTDDKFITAIVILDYLTASEITNLCLEMISDHGIYALNITAFRLCYQYIEDESSKIGFVLGNLANIQAAFADAWKKEIEKQ